jgi:ABC-2 type transport system permease protein
VTGRPLLYLTVCSLRNRLRVRLRRLREPRYLIASVIGVAYFWLILFGRGRRPGGSGGLRLIALGRTGVETGSTIVLFITAALAWILPGSRRPALAFSRAEVQHLFTAPIPRHQLVRYRVLRSQIGALIGSTITTLFLGPASVAEGAMVFLGLVLLMGTVNLHMTGVSLSRAAQGWRRRLPQAIAATAVLVVIGTVAAHWSELTTAAATGGSVAAVLNRLSTTGAVSIVLWPFRTLARLPLAHSGTAFLIALPPVLALLAINYLWVLRTDVPFEEASAELSEKLDLLRRRGARAVRQPRASTRTPFTLAAQGRPEVAILWKNLISMGRMLSWVMLVRIGAITVFLATMLSRGRSSSASLMTFAGLFVAGFALVLGPQMMRSDLRQDLGALAVLKTWPIRGAALVRGEVLAPALVLTAIVFVALIAAAATSVQAPFAADIPNRWSLLVAALLVAPGLLLAQMLVHNALAVIFPSWVSIGARPGGVDVVGQRLLVMVAVMLALVAAVLPAAIVAGAAVGLVYMVTGTSSVVLAGVLGGATLLVEVWIGSEVIGAILERSDISAVDAPDF